MYLFLLKKALPFTLTFIVGAALSAVTGLFGASEKRVEHVRFTTRTYEFGSRCRVRRRYLVAESKPLRITFKPDATLSVGPDSLRRGTGVRVLAVVTFGADGKVQGVESASILSACGKYRSDEASGDILAAVKLAASQIQFEPETVDGMPVTVTREVEMAVAFN
jgi:hypothetical protein